MINEILAHTDDPLLDYIELYNHSNQAVDLSGCILTCAAKMSVNLTQQTLPPHAMNIIASSICSSSFWGASLRMWIRTGTCIERNICFLM